MIQKQLDYVIRQNNAILAMLGSVIDVMANQYGLTKEHVEEECEYIDELDGTNS